jgi:glutathione S-transferase
MTLELHSHPLASYCWKALIALYENETPFEARLVDLGNAEGRARFERLWPMAKMPVLRDPARDETVAEATIVIEYLATHYPGKVQLVPADPDRARQVRFRDRFFDLYVMEPMQKIVGDRLRPEGKHDPHGVELAHASLRKAYAVLTSELRPRPWAVGEEFTMADCAAGPALFYAAKVEPFGEGHDAVATYLARLVERPSFARVIAEAEPYFKLFPG